MGRIPKDPQVAAEGHLFPVVVGYARYRELLLTVYYLAALSLVVKSRRYEL